MAHVNKVYRIFFRIVSAVTSIKTQSRVQ